MVKTPRHSKPTDEGKTIDLDSKDVTKVDAENLDNETKDTSNEAKPDQKSSDEKTASSETKNDVQKDTTKGSSSPVTAGVIGAVIALAGGAGLQWAGILPSAQNSAPQISAEISEKISGLEQSLTALDTRFSEQSTSDSASLMGSLSAVTSRIDALETLVQNDNSGALEAISTINSRLDELSAQIITLEQTPTLTSENGVALPDGLQDEIANLVALSAAQAIEINNLKALIEATAQASTVDEATQQSIADMQSRLANAEAALEKSQGDVPIALSLAAVTIKNAIDRGGRFTVELDAYAQLDGDNPALPELRKIADAGVLSRSDLLQQFDTIANQIIAADKPETAETDIMARLLDSAANMVKIRKVGEIEGDTAEAIVARMEQRLIAGELESAMNEWQKLPDPSKAVSQNYSDQLQARITAEKLADQLLQARPATAG
ncbi:MAG: hypothetical protein JJ858_03165 [Rhizobiaceae bacterium]|nr:hypothetical protein [Rhizobiaceae bacterium]